jgi:LIM domain
MVFCSACGANCPSGAFCNKCGKPLAGAPPAQQQQQQQVQMASTGPAKVHAPVDVDSAGGITTSTYAADMGTAGSCHKCKKAFPPGTKQGFYLEALGSKFHKECFNCDQCGTRIFSFTKFFASPDGLPICNTCNSSTAPNCIACGKPAPNHVVLEGKKYHKDCMICAGVRSLPSPSLLRFSRPIPHPNSILSRLIIYLSACLLGVCLADVISSRAHTNFPFQCGSADTSEPKGALFEDNNKLYHLDCCP